MKAILVRDEMPTHCGDCEYCVEDNLHIGLVCVAAGCEDIDEAAVDLNGTAIDIDETKPGWCPWRPAPERRHEDDDSFSRAMQARGWNEALKEIGL